MQGVIPPNYKAQSEGYELAYKGCLGLACIGTLTCLGSWLFQARWATSMSFKATLLTGSAASLVAAYVFKQRYEHAAAHSSIQTSCARLKASIEIQDPKSDLATFIVDMEAYLGRSYRLADQVSDKDIVSFAQQFDKLSNFVVCANRWKNFVDNFDTSLEFLASSQFEQYCEEVANWSVAWLDFFNNRANDMAEINDRIKNAELLFFSDFCLNERSKDSEVVDVKTLSQQATKLFSIFEEKALRLPLRKVLLSQIDYIVKTLPELEQELAACKSHPQKKLIELTLNARLESFRQWCTALTTAADNDQSCYQQLHDLRLFVLRNEHYQRLHHQLMAYPSSPREHFIPMSILKNDVPPFDASEGAESQLLEQSNSHVKSVLQFHESFDLKTNSWSLTTS
jgi:hypothetical protein